MKKHLPTIAGIALGLLFVFAAVTYFLKMVPTPDFPAGSPIAMFFGAFGPTGYMGFVKVCELLGGILVAIPRTRNFGLLVLVPIIVNIVAFTAFITGPKELLNWMLGAIVALAVYLLWVARKNVAGLLNY